MNTSKDTLKSGNAINQLNLLNRRAYFIKFFDDKHDFSSIIKHDFCTFEWFVAVLVILPMLLGQRSYQY
ncbi:hypothetical protein [Moraxella lacunata]|uniref:hypothetical protein n=1 Tax=Moraxella lacunata TaxID=477 RepID=UPI003EE261E3